MTRTKRWIAVASTVAALGGGGYGAYTQRHLVLGELQPAATATDKKSDAKTDSSKPEFAPPKPIALAAYEEDETTPLPSNPLRSGRRDASAHGDHEHDQYADDQQSPRHWETSRNSPPPSFPARSEDPYVDEEPSQGGALTPPPFPAQHPQEYADDQNSTHQHGDAEAAKVRFASNQGKQAGGDQYADTSEEAGPLPPARFASDRLQQEEASDNGTPDNSPLAPPRFGGAPADEVAANNLTSSNEAISPPPLADRTAQPPIGAGISATGVGLPSRVAPASLEEQNGEGAIEGTGKPGARELDGTQSPSIAIEKFAPSEVQIGKPAKFDIKVKNVGQATAENVNIRDQIPRGTRLIDSTPRATDDGEGGINWAIGTLRPGEEKSVSVQLMPVGEGEIGSVATVTFSAQASARTTATRPQLLLESSAPRQVLIGQTVTVAIRLSNPGTGAATRVVIEEDVPEGLMHPGGQALEFEAGTLKPGESRELELLLKADKAGIVQNVIRARAEANLSVESRADIEIIAPQIALAVEGPTKRYLERQATHELIISNPGSAPAKNVEMIAHLPKGLKYVSANNQGQYDAASHAVFWSLEQLGPRDSGKVELTTLPLEAGQQKIRIESKADMNLASAQEHVLEVEGLAALFFEVADAADPIEVGGETIYEIRVINQGSKTSTNVRLAAALPPALKPVEVGGATTGQINGQTVIFEPLARLAPKADALFRIRVQGLEKGNQRVGVQLVSDEIPNGVTKEESTRVYSDQE